MKPLFETVKVEYNGHLYQYEVYYRKWFVWRFDSCYKHDLKGNPITHYHTQEEARVRAIDRAKGMLNSYEVFRESNFFPYV